jgi:hypothetical protein
MGWNDVGSYGVQQNGEFGSTLQDKRNLESAIEKGRRASEHADHLPKMLCAPWGAQL